MAHKEINSVSSIMLELQTLTKTLESIIVKNNLPLPSLGADGPEDYPTLTGDDNDACTNTRYKIVDAARNIITLALGPRQTLLRSGFSHHDNLVLAVISRYSIANAVPLDKTISIIEVSEKICLSEHLTRSILRHAIAGDECMGDAYFHDVVPAASLVLESWRRFPDSNEPGETGFSLAVGKGKTVFEYLAEDTSVRDGFSLAMSALTGGGEFHSKYLVHGYPWSDLPSGATIVDVGGSDGTVASALVSQYPGFHLIVQDLEGVVSHGREALPPGSRDLISFQAHDFFTPQPVQADVYILRHILHDWSDKYCIQILRHLVASMKPSSKIIINDAIMVEPTETSAEQYWMMSAMNLQMITLLNAKERTLRGWKELLSKADSRLTISTVRKPIGVR